MKLQVKFEELQLWRLIPLPHFGLRMTKPPALEKQRVVFSARGGSLGSTAINSCRSMQMSKDYADRAQQFADARVLQTLEKYHSNRAAALYSSGKYSSVDRSQWKLSKGGRRHAISCYKKVSSRALFNGLRKSHSTKHGQHAADGMRVTMALNKSAPSVPISEKAELLAIGVVPGTLEDVLHGSVNLTPEAMQIESLHTQCDLLDSRVLSALVLPSINAPFRSLTLKWALRHHEVLSRHRDYVYLEATGVLQDAKDNSAKVGFHLVHSVSLPSAPELASEMQIVRGHVSYCYLYRQHSASEVELFFYGGILPRGGAKDRIAFQIMADTVLMSPNTIECATMKKLAYSLRTKSSRSSISFSRSSEMVSCCVCQRPVRAIFSRKVASCELCEEPVCHRCRVYKKIFVIDSGVFHPQKMKFCVECTVTTNHLNAEWVASQELNGAVYRLRLSEQTISSKEEYVDTFQNGLGFSRPGSTDKGRKTILGDSLVSSSTRHSAVWLPTDHLLSYPISNGFKDVVFEKEGQRYTQLQDDSLIDTEAFVALNDDDDQSDEVIPMIEISSEGEEDEYGNENKHLNHAVDFVCISKSSQKRTFVSTSK